MSAGNLERLFLQADPSDYREGEIAYERYHSVMKYDPQGDLLYGSTDLWKMLQRIEDIQPYGYKRT